MELIKMRVKKEITKIVEIKTCDFCGKVDDDEHEYYYKCDVCGKDYCRYCRPSSEENDTHLSICKNCIEPMEDFIFDYMINSNIEELNREDLYEKEKEVISKIRKEHGYTYKAGWEK
jgi:hypothetical protein